MPTLELSQLLPIAPLHWTTILHYALLLGALFILVSSQSDVSLVFIFILAVLALITAADLYSNLVAIPPFVIFLFRVGMLGIPLLLGGLSPSQETRGIGIIMGLLAGLPLFAIVFLGCFIPFMADPRVVGWCAGIQ